MESDRFKMLVKQHKTGERVRVLFDILMEFIEASPDSERFNFWEKLREKMMGEQEAMQELTKNGTVEPPKMKRKKRTVKVPVKGFTDDKVDNQLSLFDE